MTLCPAVFQDKSITMTPLPMSTFTSLIRLSSCSTNPILSWNKTLHVLKPDMKGQAVSTSLRSIEDSDSHNEKAVSCVNDSMRMAEVAILSDSSAQTGISAEFDNQTVPKHMHAKLNKTPICRFYKQGELIRKSSLCKPRRRKNPPMHKKEIFGSPFSSDYFVKPLSAGYHAGRFTSQVSIH